MTNEMTNDSMQRHISQSKEVLVRTVGTETVLLNLGNEEYFTLDAIGAAMWQLLDGSRTLRQVAEAIVAEYDADIEEVSRDVHDLVEDLLAEHLVMVV